MLSKNTILIVEDDKENIAGLRAILDDEYDVFVAINGEGALNILRTTQPDLILLDIGLPDMDGFDVMERLRNLKGCESIPVIFITGETDVYVEEYGLSKGAEDYIRKPYVPNVLLVKVQNSIERKMSRDQLEWLVQQRTRELVYSREMIIMGMSFLAERRDLGTGKHIKRIMKYTKILVDQIAKDHPGLISQRECEEIILYSSLHDVGKVGIPDSILLKPGRLTREEFEVIKTHTTIGADVLAVTASLNNEFQGDLKTAIDIAECHHEKWNGSGYPHGYVGEQIPIAARIISLPDIYDALTNRRSYKEAYRHDMARDIIVNGDGRTMPEHFDPIVLNAFIATEKQFAELCVDDELGGV
ncbi:MAG: response regulator [Lachnospiraceae bacterium]|jgi:putative two-component system response regulator|nr:response regulator [Lachnospiraceae bacterium]